MTYAYILNYKATSISTHTLTWSVTNQILIINKYTKISTHTLTWSVTFFACSANHEIEDFNSHAHVERDNQKAKPFTRYNYFNSHAHVERDGMSVKFIGYFGISTHTLTWSVTNDLCVLYIVSLHFNSHAHVERDVFLIYSTYSVRISTHTLTWSVTISDMVYIDLIINIISTHTLTWSVTREYPHIVRIYFISTHTLTWSVT